MNPQFDQDQFTSTPSNDAFGTPDSQSGPPLMGTSFENYDELGLPPSPGMNKLYVGIGICSLALVGFGVFKSLTATPEASAPKPQVESIWSQQQQVMRDAMDMAREAQQLQREHMEQMRREIEMAEFGYVPDESGHE